MPDIAHVVVLMLENRSFDSMLGRLYSGRPDFDGLTGQESNQWDGKSIPVWTSTAMTPDAACIPTPDPNELFADMTDQIFGVGSGPPSPANMSGFVANYMKTATNDPTNVMHGFTPDQVPVISQLARSFGVSDRWHRIGAYSDLAQPFFRPHRHSRRLCKQLAHALSLHNADDL